MLLYWFIPALANSRVGSDSGTTDDDGTAKKVSKQLTRHPQPKIHPLEERIDRDCTGDGAQESYRMCGRSS